MTDNVIYDVWYRLFHYQKVDSSVYIGFSGHQSSDNGKRVLTHHGHPHFLSWLPLATICDQPPPFDPRDCKVPLATPDGCSLSQFAIRGYEG